MKKIIHVNQHVIKANRKNNTKNPPLTCKSYKDNIYANDIIVEGPCRIRYSPDKPLPCGAHVWIETTSDVTFEKEFNIDNLNSFDNVEDCPLCKGEGVILK